MEKEFNFTKRSVDALPIPGKGKRAIYRDKKTPGLGIRITGTGSKSFVVYRKMKGRPLMVTLGKYPQMTIEQARNEALDANQKINAGNNPNDEKRSIKDEETFGGLFQVYMDLHSKVHKRSWKDDQQRYDSYLSKWRNKKLSNIKSSDIQALHSKIGKESGIYAANRTLSLISSMFSKASDWGWKQGNPAKGIKKFKEQSRDRFLQADELPRFFKALANEPNTTVRDFFLVALLTGARRANVLAMRWDQISFEREEWKIPETKAGESHTLPLVAGVIDVLRQRKAEAKRKAEEEKTEGSPFVFPGHGKTGHLVEPKTAWKRILSRAALYGLIDQIAVSCEWDAQQRKEWEQKALEESITTAEALKSMGKEKGLSIDEASMNDLRVHDLRRSLGSWQAATGANLSIIGKTLAHKNVSTTAIYARLNIDPVRESMTKAADAMLEAGGLLPKADVVRLKK